MENKKTTQIVLLIIFIIILFILLLYFINIIKVENKKEELIPSTETTTTTNKNYIELTTEEKVYFNNYFNDIILIALNNSIYDKLQTFDENLIQREESKFKFIYSYLILNNYKEGISLEDINEYSNKFFKTNLNENNLQEYLKNNKYYYEVYKELPYYCLKAVGKENEDLILEMITYDEINCTKEKVEYEEKFILKRIKLSYEIEEELILKSIKIEGKNQ